MNKKGVRKLSFPDHPRGRLKETGGPSFGESSYWLYILRTMGYGWLTVTPVARVPVIYHIFFTALETKENIPVMATVQHWGWDLSNREWFWGKSKSLMDQSGFFLHKPNWIFYINQSGQSSHSINSGRTQRGMETLPPMIICLLQDTFLMKPLESNMVSSDGLLRRLPGPRPQYDVESRVSGQNNPKMGMSPVPPKWDALYIPLCQTLKEDQDKASVQFLAS